MRLNLILIEPEFNNFYVLYTQLHKLMTKDDLVVTNHRMVMRYTYMVWDKISIFDEQTYDNREYDRVIIFSNKTETPLYKDFVRIAKKTPENIDIGFKPEDIITPSVTGRVVHCKKTPFDIYIGREAPKLPASKWKNPYPMENESCRDNVIWGFTWHLIQHPELFNKLPELKDKILGCWCANAEGTRLCHGHLLVWLADRNITSINSQ